VLGRTGYRCNNARVAPQKHNQQDRGEHQTVRSIEQNTERQLDGLSSLSDTLTSKPRVRRSATALSLSVFSSTQIMLWPGSGLPRASACSRLLIKEVQKLSRQTGSSMASSAAKPKNRHTSTIFIRAASPSNEDGAQTMDACSIFRNSRFAGL